MGLNWKNKEGWMSGVMEVWQLTEEQRARSQEVKPFNKSSLIENLPEQQNDKNLSTVQPFNSKRLALLSSKCAFTLSEVLITIAVVGVVAAMTLPSLIKNYNNYVTEQKLKKAYNTVYNAIRMAEVDNGPMKDWPKSEEMEVYSYFDTYFKPYFKGIKLCKNTTDCGYKNFNIKQWQEANTNWSICTDNSRLLFQLIDGTVVFYPRNSGNWYVSFFYVDINGTQKPNTFEKDVFLFKRGTTKSIEPTGKALEIMQNGWKIK